MTCIDYPGSELTSTVMGTVFYVSEAECPVQIACNEVQYTA